MIPSIYNIQPKRLKELLDECIAELGGEEGVQNAIRQEKATIIEDIMRGYKIAQLYSKTAIKAINNPVWAFDKLYEMDLPTLEAYNKALDKHNTDYMRRNVERHNNGTGDDFWMLYDNNFK